MRRIAIIGAGMSGLACAEALAAEGFAVTVFDKGRTPAGRMSSRRLEAGGRSFRFDFGAQFFTARDSAFSHRVRRWAEAGLVAPWPEAGEEAWVGVPAMDAPLQAVAAGLDIRSGIAITALEREARGWRLAGDETATRFDAVVVAIPAEQAAALVADHAPGFAGIAGATPAAPCWAVMAAFDTRLSIEADTLRHAGPIGWAARDGAKPGRGDTETWVVHGTPGWSAERREAGPQRVADELLAALGAAANAPLPTPVVTGAHSWLLARSGNAGRDLLWDPASGLGLCGDWLTGPRVENAWLAGDRLARAIGERAGDRV